MAQSGMESGSSPNTNSPYTRYGWGMLSDQSFGNSKAMGGIAYGLRDGSQINPSNPASYTAIDSLTFLFDGGMTFQNTNLSEKQAKLNAKNTSFDYVAMQFRLCKRLAMTIGFLPFSSVGYNISTEKKITGTATSNLTAASTYSGSGGIDQLFVGAGFKVYKDLSVGVNVSYLFGTVTRSSVVSFSDNSFATSYKSEQFKIKDYKLDLGIQYTRVVASKQRITAGVVYSLKHRLNNESYKANQGVINESGYEFDFPHCFGAGVTYIYDNRLTVGFDYTLQKWGEVNYFSATDRLNDRSKYSVGAEFVPNPFKRNYLCRIKYRIGAYYSSPYVKVKGDKDACEFGVSAGLGLPVFQSKSLLNISAQYIKVKPQTSDLIGENYLKLSIGLTFNERWFAKWKVQ